MPGAVAAMIMNNNQRLAEDAESLEECQVRLDLLAAHFKIAFVVETTMEEYITIFGNKKKMEVERLMIKPL